MILKIFFWGMLAAIPAVVIEVLFSKGTDKLLMYSNHASGAAFLISLLNIFIGVALVEEFLKYLVVKEKVLKSSECDEPLDVMLYMIISALGFVVFENLLLFLSPDMFSLGLNETIFFLGFRFISATFFHALASGTLGFFMALSFLETKKRGMLLFFGMSLVVILHGLYDFSIMKIEGLWAIPLPVIIILGLAIFVSFAFRKLKKMASVCKVNS
jgi:RsiW-degrading membrane proteinase PrsW (M82 family)